MEEVMTSCLEQILSCELVKLHTILYFMSFINFTLPPGLDSRMGQVVLLQQRPLNNNDDDDDDDDDDNNDWIHSG